MKCQACNRQLKAPANMIGRYAYGPVCFSRMVPKSVSVPSRTKRVEVVTDKQTLDLFAPCYFDTMGEADRLEILAKQG